MEMMYFDFKILFKNGVVSTYTARTTKGYVAAANEILGEIFSNKRIIKFGTSKIAPKDVVSVYFNVETDF